MRERELGRILVAMGVIRNEQLDDALEYLGRVSGTTLGQALQALDIVDEVTVAKALCRHFKLPFVSLVGAQTGSQVIALVPGAIARKHGVVPVAIRGEILLLATADPWEAASPSDLGLRLDRKFAFALTDSTSLAQALDRYY